MRKITMRARRRLIAGTTVLGRTARRRRGLFVVFALECLRRLIASTTTLGRTARRRRGLFVTFALERLRRRIALTVCTARKGRTISLSRAVRRSPDHTLLAGCRCTRCTGSRRDSLVVVPAPYSRWA